MKYQIEYMPLNYYHSQVSDECLCLGVLFHELTTDTRKFFYISNFKRFQAFDDEADVTFIKAYLKSIEDDISTNLFSTYKTFSLKEYKQIFVNDFRFQQILSIDTNDYKTTMENISKLYLKYDFEKSKRLSSNNEKELIRQILLSQQIDFTKDKIKGSFDDEITFDYVSNNLYVKIFSFNGSNLKPMINKARQWAFAASEVNSKGNVLYIYDSDGQDTKNLNTIKNILKSNATIANISEASNIIKTYAI